MIVACYAGVGDIDYLAHILARDMTDLDEFLRSDLWRLPGVKRFATTIAMREIRSDGSLAANAARKK